MPEPGSEDPSRDQARVGALLGGKWRLERLLGIGGMASVYAASHRNGAVAAIKILHPEFARSTEIRSRFMREGYIANTAGPGAVRVLDDDVDDDGAPYLVMELLTGEPVAARAERKGGGLPLTEVLWVASEALATLAVAHGHGIIHRDLKPENLFWTVDGTIKILDFGIARLHSNTRERTMTGTVLGTPAFMSHEQALGLATEMDGRTDVWAMGAIMFFLLTGRDVHPFGEGNELVIAATKHAPPVSIIDPEVPAAVASIVDRALQFEQADRYPTATAMRDDILRVVSEEELHEAIRGAPPSRVLVPNLPPAQRVSEAVEAPGPGLATGMSDDDTHALRTVLDLLEVAMLTRDELLTRDEPRWKEAARLGGFRRLEMAFRQATTALEGAHIGLFWNVLPEGFATKHGLLWVAKPPLAPVPSDMFGAGVRMLGFLPGLTLEELSEVTRLLRGDLAPFHDYATMLQSSQLPHLVYRIDPTKPGMSVHPSISIDSSMSGEARVLPMVEALATSDPALRAALLARLERVGDGHEGAIGALLPEASVELAMGLLRVLALLGSDAARVAMASAERNPSPIVRIFALSHRDPGGDALQTELREAITTGESAERTERLLSFEVYKMTAAGPPLALRIAAGSFDLLPVAERRQAFATLAALLPSRAETLAVRLVQDQRVMSTEAHEKTRELACEVLGRIGTSKAAEEALVAAVQTRGKASQGLRIAASVALDAFAARASRPTGGS